MKRKLNIKRIVIFILIILLIIIGIILLINKKIKSKNINNQEETINVFKESEYYIEENLERYKSYQEENNDLDVEEIIKCVNANIDYSFYTNIKSTDTSKGILLITNKYYKLDINYVPDNLVSMSSSYSITSGETNMMNSIAYEAFKKMVDAASEDGIKLYNVSAYRSYSLQNELYTSYSTKDGIAAADRYSARPGHSEHQTGLASDINTANSNDHFEDTKEYAWLIKNSYKYGFILRYPKGKEYITGYKYEPWHYRYVGIEAATYIYEHDITYEEYYAVFVK